MSAGAAGCGGGRAGGGQLPGDRWARLRRPFSERDLPVLGLQDGDVPDGYHAFKVADDLALCLDPFTSPGGRDRPELSSSGLRACRSVEYRLALAGGGGRAVVSTSFLFEDAAGASRALAVLREARSGVLESTHVGVSDVAADGLGDEPVMGLSAPVAVRPLGLTLTEYLWRVRNAVRVLSEYDHGDVGGRTTFDTANRVDERLRSSK